MKIVIGGDIGSGKTSIGKLLSQHYQYPFISVGGIRRKLARERGITIQEFNKIGEVDPKTDEIPDEYQKKLGKSEKDFVFEGRLSWYFIPNAIKIFLKVDKKIGAKRIIQEKRDSEAKVKTMEEQIKLNKERFKSDTKRYLKIYNIKNYLDPKNFDIVLDTTHLNKEQVLQKVLQEIKIFLQPKPKERKVLIDYREKNSLVPSELVGLGTKIEFTHLKVADYVIEDIAIERKTLSDFISSMINKRLLRQLEDLKQYPKPLIIIEGHKKKFEFDINPNAFKGFLLSISLSHKIPIIFTENAKETARYIDLIVRKKPTSMSLNVSKKNLTKKQQLQFILESLPKIGPKTSEKLLKNFKSIKNIVNASQTELEEILGKKAEEVYETINREF